MSERDNPQKRAEEEKIGQENEIKEWLKEDPRYIALFNIAFSPELTEALNKFSVKRGHYYEIKKSKQKRPGMMGWIMGDNVIEERVNIPGRITREFEFPSKNMPVGHFIVTVSLCDDRWDGDRLSDVSEELVINIAWRQNPEKRIQEIYEREIKIWDPDHRQIERTTFYTGINANSGLGITAEYIEGGEDNYRNIRNKSDSSLPVFGSLEALIDHLSNLIV